MGNLAILSSAANPLLQDVRKAIARGGVTSQGWAVAEGWHMAHEALRSGRGIEHLLASESARPRAEAIECGRLSILPDKLFASVAATETTQGVMALVDLPARPLEELFGTGPTLVLDGVQDPGNAGTMVRAAEAFGAAGVLFLKGSVHALNPKTLRASAGSLFRVPFAHGTVEELWQEVERRALPCFAAMAGGGARADRALLPASCVLVLGSEGQGVSEFLRARAQPLTIPTTAVESLNVAVSAAILLYEAQRQRGTR